MINRLIKVNTADTYQPGLVIVVLLAGFLQACSITPTLPDGAPSQPVDVTMIPNAVPKVENRSKYGNPESYVINGKKYNVMQSSDGYIESGIASWYGTKFHGKRTSSGETYDMYGMTAAHKKLPLPTYVEVTNLKNRKSVIVKVNDRGPFHENRIIDLSFVAAKKLDIVASGTGLVEIRALNPHSSDNDDRTVKKHILNTGQEKFYIQVGSFSQYENAERLQKRLAVLENASTHISEIMLNGEMLYRVKIGPITDVELADRIVAELGNYGIHDHHVVLGL